MSITPFLRGIATAFSSTDIKAMSFALDDVCETLNVNINHTAREIIAIRIIELAQHGETCSTKLRDMVLQDARSGSGC